MLSRSVGWEWPKLRVTYTQRGFARSSTTEPRLGRPYLALKATPLCLVVISLLRVQIYNPKWRCFQRPVWLNLELVCNRPHSCAPTVTRALSGIQTIAKWRLHALPRWNLTTRQTFWPKLTLNFGPKSEKNVKRCVLGLALCHTEAARVSSSGTGRIIHSCPALESQFFWGDPWDESEEWKQQI